MSTVVRRANLTDLETLVDFTASEAREAEGIGKDAGKIRAAIRTALENEAIATYWIMENVNQEALGHISVVKEWSDWNAGYYWWIQSVYLKPEYRGQRLINQLLQTVRDSAITNQAVELRLYVHKTNERAIKAYVKLGFVNADYQIMRMML